jgi:NAD(P)-dependent dehydrogenase (short-subunit alcohol dehydrogenase family)
MNKWLGKVAVVTGAGSGIGSAIFKALSKAGLNVVGLDLHRKQVEVGTKILTINLN